jgi:hypothetical protein
MKELEASLQKHQGTVSARGRLAMPRPKSLVASAVWKEGILQKEFVFATQTLSIMHTTS